jgi:hypothetical protein
MFFDRRYHLAPLPPQTFGLPCRFRLRFASAHPSGDAPGTGELRRSNKGWHGYASSARLHPPPRPPRPPRPPQHQVPS